MVERGRGNRTLAPSRCHTVCHGLSRVLRAASGALGLSVWHGGHARGLSALRGSQGARPLRTYSRHRPGVREATKGTRLRGESALVTARASASKGRAGYAHCAPGFLYPGRLPREGRARRRP